MATVQEVVDSFGSYKGAVDAKLAELKASIDALAQDPAALDALKAQIDSASAELNPAPVEG
jgi:ABC-type transporter Mla subunit MlaD